MTWLPTFWQCVIAGFVVVAGPLALGFVMTRRRDRYDPLPPLRPRRDWRGDDEN